MNNLAEFFSLPHVVAIGRRKMLVSPDGKRDNEVYVRLLSGSSFAVASACSNKQAKRTLKRLADEMMGATGCSFVATPTDFIPMQHVARIYTDRQERSHVAMIEDSSSASYLLVSGSQQQCDEAVRQVSATVLQYLQKGEAG